MVMKPRHKDWIIFGLMGTIGLIAFSFLAKVVFHNEAGIDLTQPPVRPSAQQQYGGVYSIYVPKNGVVQFEGETIEAAALETRISALVSESELPPKFILRINENVSHKTLVDLKGILDSNGAASIIELIRNPAQ